MGFVYKDGAAKTDALITWLLEQKQPTSYTQATTAGAAASLLTEAQVIICLTTLREWNLIAFGKDMLDQTTTITIDPALGRHMAGQLKTILAEICAPTTPETTEETINGPPARRGAPKGNFNAAKHGHFSPRLRRVITLGSPQVPDNPVPLKRQLDMLTASIDDVADQDLPNLELMRQLINTLARCTLVATAITANSQQAITTPGTAWMENIADPGAYTEYEFPLPAGYIWQTDTVHGRILIPHPDNANEHPSDPDTYPWDPGI